MLGVLFFGFQHVERFACRDRDRISDAHLRRDLRIVDVDRTRTVDEIEPAGLVSVGVGDPGDDARDLDFFIGHGIARRGDRHRFIVFFVVNRVVVREFDDPTAFDFFIALVILQDAGKQDLVSGDRFGFQSGIAVDAVFTVGAVNRDFSGGIVDRHRAVVGVVDRFDRRTDIITIGRSIARSVSA